jgi:hypothetical protein
MVPRSTTQDSSSIRLQSQKALHIQKYFNRKYHCFLQYASFRWIEKICTYKCWITFSANYALLLLKLSNLIFYTCLISVCLIIFGRQENENQIRVQEIQWASQVYYVIPNKNYSTVHYFPKIIPHNTTVHSL